MEAIQVFWQNWYGFVAEINNFHGVAYQRHLPFFKRHPEFWDKDWALVDTVEMPIISEYATALAQLYLQYGKQSIQSDSRTQFHRQFRIYRRLPRRRHQLLPAYGRLQILQTHVSRPEHARDAADGIVRAKLHEPERSVL